MKPIRPSCTWLLAEKSPAASSAAFRMPPTGVVLLAGARGNAEMTSWLTFVVPTKYSLPGAPANQA